jgi:hypothetical protein
MGGRLSSRLLSDDEFFGGSAGGSNSLLSDDEFMGGGAAPQKPAQNRNFIDDMTKKRAAAQAQTAPSAVQAKPDDEFLGGKPAAAPAAQGGGFIDQVKKGFISGLVDQNPQMVGNAMEAIAELSEPSGAQHAGEVVGGMVPTKPGGPIRPMEESPQRLRDLANKVKAWGDQGSETRQPSVPSVASIRLSHLIGDAADYAGYMIGSGLGTSAPSIAAGVAGAAATKSPLGFIASAAGPSYVQNLGDTYGALLENQGVQKAMADGKITRKQVASIAAEAAIPMAALDAASLEGVIGLNATGLKQTIVKRLMQRVITGALTEGTTEGIQQVIQEASIDYAGGDKTLAQQAVSVIDNAIGGALAGGTMSAGGSHAAGSLAHEAEPPLTEQNIPQGAANAETLFGQESAGGAPPPPADTAAGGPPPPPAATSADVEKERPNSPRLTPEDRASPLPNNLIDDGKKIFEEALGGNKQAAAAPAPEIAPSALPAAPPASAEPVAGPVEPAAVEAAPAGALLPDHEFLTTERPAEPNPTPAQAEAGNYQHRHVQYAGLDISIENEPGSIRRGTDASGKPWQVEMPAAYGYVKKTVGSDGDQVDVYLGPSHSDRVYVVDQIDPTTKAYDEHKALLGFGSREEAIAAYEKGFSDGKGAQRIGAVTEMPMFGFKSWLKTGDTTQPLSYTGTPQAVETTPQIEEKKLTQPSEPAPVDAKQRAAPAQKGPRDIIQFLAQQGGIQDFKGEMRAIDAHKAFVPGVGKLMREKGMPLDTAREAAAEMGYFDGKYGDRDTASEKSTVADLLDLIAETRRGNRQYAGSEQDTTVEPEKVDRLQQEVEAHAKEHGLQIDDAMTSDILGRIADGMDVDEAVAEVAERHALEFEGETHDSRGQGEPNLDDIPFDIPQAPDAGSAGKTGQGAEDQGRDRQGSDGGAARGGEAPRQQSRGAEPDRSRQEGQVAPSIDDIRSYAKGVVGKDIRSATLIGSIAAKGRGNDIDILYDIGARDLPANSDDAAAAVQDIIEGLPVNLDLGIYDSFFKVADRYFYLASGAGAEIVENTTYGKDQGGKPSVLLASATTEELGAEGKPQTVVPGAEKISQAEQAQRGADERMKPKAPQKDAGELFDTQARSERQDDLFGAPAEKQAETAKPTTPDLANAFADFFANPENRFDSIVQARKFASEHLGTKIDAGTIEAKQVDEAIELGAVMAARQMVQSKAEPSEKFYNVLDLYDRQPNLSVRTSTSVANQAYSTPLPLAYVASRLAGITRATSVFEPTAGNGALLIEASPSRAQVNELDGDRRQALETQGFRPTDIDAASPSLRTDGPVDVVIANPPFGPVKDDMGRSIEHKVDERYTTTEIDHAISLNALKAMKDDGSAVLILGGVNKLARSEEARSDAYNGKAKREFYFSLYNLYNVVDHFTVAGELYAKQGAGWPVDVIVIRGKGKSALKLPAADVPRVLDSWEQVRGLLDVQYPAANATGRQAGGTPVSAAREPAEGGNAGSRPEVQGSGAPAGRGEAGPERPGSVLARPDRDNGNELAPDRAPESGGNSAEGENAGAVRGQSPVAKPQPAADIGARQIPYTPKSGQQGMNTLVPVNMRDATQASLDGLEERVGNLDDFVAKELGYSKKELNQYFGAEQVDGIALAIDNFTKGSGLIIGDQTGIGKGRQVAAILRWASRKGKVPIFVTEKPTLYADMYRDLTDIGMKNPRIFMTNAGETVPVDDAGTVVKSKGRDLHNAEMSKMAAAGKLQGYDFIFTTYSQMQTVQASETQRMNFLRSMAQANGVVVFDESHNAGGTAAGKADEKMNRAKFARELVNNASAVLYSSATYAKRPDVMDLYSKTDMRLAVDDIEKLGDLISSGGVPMQQIVASMLSRAGQYVRRERSFEGVTYDTAAAEADKTVYDGFSRSIKQIQVFSEAFVKSATKGISRELKADARSVNSDGSTGGAGASSTNFTAVLHNLINQMLLAIKADTAVDMAIDTIKRGEKPVITVANTMESFINEYADLAGLHVGDATDLDFRSLLQRYLERSRIITIKKPFSKEKGERHRLTDDELGPDGVAQFEATKAMINGIDFSSLRASPIDWMKSRLRQAGYKVGEITGRGLIIDYRADGQGVLNMRPGSEMSIAGKRKAISDFNNGGLDVLILNRSGSTGLSLHASERVKDQRKRHMILAQPESNIDTHMQMLGRVHRTGQVVTPRYSQLVANIPAEKRPAAVLAKKMASLNANTTASRGGALTAENVPDFMNEFGDMVAASVMADNPDVHDFLGNPLTAAKDGYEKEEAMRKVTGRIPLLPTEMQEQVYDMLESEYNALIEQLEAAGENTLEAKTVPLDAKLIDRREVKAPVDSASPFADGVWFDKVDVKQIGKPMHSQQVINALAETLGEPQTATKDNAEQMHRVLKRKGLDRMDADMRKAFGAYRAYEIDALDGIKDEEARKAAETKLEDVRRRWRRLASELHPGAGVKLETVNMGNLYGIVLDVKKTGKSKNPLALGAWKATIAMADASRQMTLPFSQLFTSDTAPSEQSARAMQVTGVESIGSMPLVKAFDDLQTDRREERHIVTGNLLAGFDQVRGRGSIINYTDHEGQVRQGIIMKRDFDPDVFMNSKPIKLGLADHVLRYLDRVKGVAVVASDKASLIRLRPNGDIAIITDASKAKGGQYFLNKRVLEAAGRDFVKVGGEMKLEVPPTTALRVIDAMMKAGATYEATQNLDVAREITGEEQARGQMFSLRDETRAKLGPTDRFSREARGIGNRLRDELNRLGLGDVGLRISETLDLMVDGKALPANGSYFRKLITVSLDADNPDSVLDHEAIHALRDVDAFTKDEWAILERKSRKEWVDRYFIRETYADFSDDIHVEEGIAHAYADWRAGHSMDGIIAKAFKKIRSILQAIGRAFGKDFRIASDVFEQVAGGEVGNRRTIIAADRLRRVMGDDGGASQGEERFKLRTPRDTEEAQQTMQGMIARGQPLDRALRLPFQFFGGVDAQGRWKPGLRLSEEAGRIITTAKIDPKGRFGWLAGPVEAARAGLIDRYGLSPEYIERDRQRKMHERSITMQGAEVLKTLADQNVGANEARVLQAILTGEAVSDAGHAASCRADPAGDRRTGAGGGFAGPGQPGEF